MNGDRYKVDLEKQFILSIHTRWFVGHSWISVTQVFADVHGEGTSATTESVSLGSELSAIALFAPQGIVVGVHVGRVQSFVAKVALEAHLVPLVSTGEQFLSGVHWLAASKANVGHFLAIKLNNTISIQQIQHFNVNIRSWNNVQ